MTRSGRLGSSEFNAKWKPSRRGSSIVNRRLTLSRNDQATQTESQEFADSNLAALVGHSVVEALFAADDSPPNTNVTIAEELAEHVVFEGLSLEAVAEIEANPQQYPGVQLLHSFRREYPQQSLAAHLVGYLGAINDKELAAKSASQRLANSKESFCDDRIGAPALNGSTTVNYAASPA